MEREGIFGRDGAALGSSVEFRDAAGLGVLAAVEEEASLGDDGDGRGAEPEVYEVEVVR